jgi:hypothetical protein
LSVAEVQVNLTNDLLLQLIEQVTAVDKQVAVVQAQAVLIINEQQRAAEGRKETHERLRKVEQSLGTVGNTVERIAPLVDSHERTHQRGMGAIWAARGFWGAVAGGTGAAATYLLQSLTGKH